MAGSCENAANVLKRFKKIPIYVVEEHNDALQFIYSAIGGKKLPLEGTTLLHLDAHPDMLIDRKLKGEDARSGRNVLPLLQIENWIVPAIAAGHIGHVVWLRPPWARQFRDGTRPIHVGDHPTTGELRVDSKEPYYLSDALYSPHLVNKRKFIFTSAELSDTVLTKEPKESNLQNYIENLNVKEPYVLDIDLDFFSTGNPFLALYENIKLYDRLLPIFDFKLPDKDDDETVDKVVESREQQLEELENLFQHLEQYDNLDKYEGEKSRLYKMVSELAIAILAEAKRLNEKPDWWAVFAGGCTRDQEGLPYHISSEEEIQRLVKQALVPLLKNLPPPVLITVARSTDDGYCPPHQVEYIQSTVLEVLKELYDTDDPALYYLTVNTF
ncbi:misexpression suppressor of ras 6 isoform X2 [Anticarsia gemmatalis]